ncbi:MAG: hypothetical protein B5M52_05875 [Helicobacteraceae bacterium 4484_230]|nr:MAG: hypothetical protein B5M52_05875 [Helicobacteraceae bacterium 4484_230]
MNLVGEYYSIIDFLDKGGAILYLIMGTAFVLWVFIIDRSVYLFFLASKDEKELLKEWNRYKNNSESSKIKEALKSMFSEKLFNHLPVIRILIKMAPLLGLLGTVYGMMEIFDVIAVNGTGDARAMADGISMATLPTMAGMAVAITGLFFQKKIEEIARKKSVHFYEGLEA